MRWPLFPTLLWLCGSCWSADLQESWQTGYTGSDATGPQVLGYWKFDAGAELKDSSSQGNDLVLNGARTGAEGRFGQGLESFPGFPVQDKPHSARVAGKGRLTPAGAFSLELWLKPKPELAATGRCYLLDKRYVPDNHTDYALQLGEPDKAGTRRLALTLGFGARSEIFHSPAFTLPEGEWQHLALTYDAAGTVVFYRNGSRLGEAAKPGLGALAPGPRPLHLGDRIGSNYGGFPGLLDEVRLCEGVRRFEPLALEIVRTRQVWRRLERAEPVTLACTNLRRATVPAGTLTLDFDGRRERFPLPELRAGASHRVQYTVNTALKPGSYALKARLEAGGAVSECEAAFEIVARPPPRMPVILWGADPSEAARLKDIGFTHCLGLRADVGEIWTRKQPVPPGKPELIEANRRLLDQALAADLGVIASLSPGRLFEGKPEMLRVGRDGKPHARQDLCASLPELPGFFENVGRSVARAYGQHPAFAAALINSEVRDASQPSFNAVDVAAYRAFAGTEIPAEATARWGVDWTKLKDFPADRVIADDHPILKYYRWFWTVGDGWNGLHSALHKGVKSGAPRGFFTFFDPAVRQPSISGAGGGVDVLSHWTYTYPDPQRIGLATDQLVAMSAASGRNQKVMKMTQLIWYRSQTAPVQAGQPASTVAWEDHDPDAAYITIAPMHLKEALWTKLSRPVQGIMYHGWQSLVPTDSPGGYRHTNPNTVHVLRELLREVVQPLGPTLLKLTDERAEVAVLESFTAQMFARRGGYGSNLGWSADLWLALQHAHVPADILFEETLLKNGLRGRKLLVLPECDVLTAPVVQAIRDWQKKGGRILADEFLCPALKADVTVPSFRRVKKAAEDKARVLALAQSLGPQIETLGISTKVRADHPEVILRSRRFGDALYVFAINDRREFGSYVGQHGLVMENGLPTKARLTLAQEDAHIYDLTRGALVIPQRAEAGRVSWPVELGPCDGRLFLVLPKPLLQIRLEAPATAKPGQSASVQATLTTTEEAPVRAAVPVEVRIRDANGRPAEGSGFHTAENGVLKLTLDLAPNDDPGTWEIRVRELASGMEAVQWMALQP